MSVFSGLASRFFASVVASVVVVAGGRCGRKNGVDDDIPRAYSRALEIRTARTSHGYVGAVHICARVCVYVLVRACACVCVHARWLDTMWTGILPQDENNAAELIIQMSVCDKIAKKVHESHVAKLRAYKTVRAVRVCHLLLRRAPHYLASELPLGRVGCVLAPVCC